MTAAAARTMFEKIWSRHRILERPDGHTLLYIDRHLIHDGYAPAFEFLTARGLKPHAPSQTSRRQITMCPPIRASFADP